MKIIKNRELRASLLFSMKLELCFFLYFLPASYHLHFQPPPTISQFCTLPAFPAPDIGVYKFYSCPVFMQLRVLTFCGHNRFNSLKLKMTKNIYRVPLIGGELLQPQGYSSNKGSKSCVDGASTVHCMNEPRFSQSFLFMFISNFQIHIYILVFSTFYFIVALYDLLRNTNYRYFKKNSVKNALEL